LEAYVTITEKWTVQFVPEFVTLDVNGQSFDQCTRHHRSGTYMFVAFLANFTLTPDTHYDTGRTCYPATIHHKTLSEGRYTPHSHDFAF